MTWVYVVRKQLCGSWADENALRAYTNGEAPDQFAQSVVGSRSSLLVLYLQQGPYIK